MTDYPIKKIQRQKSDKNGKQKVHNSATNVEKNFSVFISTKKTHRISASKYACSNIRFQLPAT
jgi:hypothetical protein